MSQPNSVKDSLKLYQLSNGKSVTSLTVFSSPFDEYHEAFKDRTIPFLIYYDLKDDQIEKNILNRGKFWDMACIAARILKNYGIVKGDHVVHAFSCNSPFDLIFRLASVLTGSVPVTINWQADNIEQILYKTRITEAKMIIYDKAFVDKLDSILLKFPKLKTFEANSISNSHSSLLTKYEPIDWEDERFIIFTSGTTGNPKGVSLSHRSYLTNRLTYESYFQIQENVLLDLLLVNPLHHTNSTALSDWGIRRKNTRIHLVSKYSKLFWKILTDTVSKKEGIIMTSLVSRHFDFLDSLIKHKKSPVEEKKIMNELSKIDILIGSAPVGPTTIERINYYSGRPPHVRFGSTETCLQVMAIPNDLPNKEVLKAFQKGLKHRYNDEQTTGYYIGREHYPFTRLKVVKSLDPKSPNYLKSCETGEPGYLITQGGNIMTEYIGNKEATNNVFQNEWYTGLRDIVFTLKTDSGDLDFYWMSRDSELLIRGGANYSYAQIEAELTKFIIDQFHLKQEDFQLAVIGLRLESEHEDSCCVTIELREKNRQIESLLKAELFEMENLTYSKGTKPDLIRFSTIPKNFKGAVLYQQLKKEFQKWIQLRNPK
jgi:acyl-CoA synthetase (AMP-forming)/AMP-acid ligase II